MQLPHSDELEIQYLSRLFDNTSECYKFFWFQAIITKVLEGKTCMDYEELINEMIADAWYMVTEYHLKLGPKDTLESLVHYLQEISNIKSCEKKENIINYLKGCDDKEVMSRKRVLTKNVPYRLQSPFMENLKGKEWNVSGISDKLYPPQERKLEKVKSYWKMILNFQPIQEIYGHNVLTEKDISIDHFVPWSYVAHDELWNLHPTTRSINSSKSNNLPDWDTYFPELARLEYLSYKMIWQYSKVQNEFEKCAKEHLNSMEVRQRIYREGLQFEEFTHALEEALQPVYMSAKNCGFRNWIYAG